MILYADAQPLDRERILTQIKIDRIEVGILGQPPHQVSATAVKTLDRDFLLFKIHRFGPGFT